MMTTRSTHDAVPDERNEHVLIYVNGEMVPRAEAKISVFDLLILMFKFLRQKSQLNQLYKYELKTKIS